MPAISVIIPAHNSRATLGEAIESVRRQTVPVGEIIVIDDASTDDTAGYVEHTHPGCRVIRLANNAGPAAARNRGVAEATGEWIAFLDADDLWFPMRLECQMGAVAAQPAVSLWCGEVHEFSGADLQEFPTQPASPLRTVLAIEDFVARNLVATSTVLVRREAFETVGGFDESVRGPEDYDLWMRLAARYKVGRIGTPLAAYRQRPDSLSQDDRTFLPQVLRVLAKAFAPGGAMGGLSWLYPTALSNQYWNASWMAFCRGARWVAVRHWFRAYRLNRSAHQRVRRAWWPLLFRYVTGQRESR